MPIQIYRKKIPPKTENFQIKKNAIFLISAQNIDCGYWLEPPRRGSSNEYPQSGPLASSLLSSHGGLCLSTFVESDNSIWFRLIIHVFVLFVLRFYGPVNPMGSCRARSVYLTTRLLGKLSPLSG